MAVDARAVANEILSRAWELGFEPTQIDVQKITYFLHGHHLLDHGVPMVQTEFEAMQYGPIQRILLDSFRKWADQPIGELAEKFDPVRRVHEQLPRIVDNAILETIDRYLAAYLCLPSFELVDMTHARNTPWSKTVDAARNSVNIGMRISDDLISSCFEGLKCLRESDCRVGSSASPAS
ncbi:DUF4065 domain-containing protein [Cereibacter azotoformans]|uniref:Uncharacterized phage-associated protein-like protein n=1 Tax=Cereibacter sphaeroides (strain ATCC 17025 / ATH 2.4.3) TaxID=349102 RepID=A4WPM0_CERS5|nr:type II toxin-antitoxin system antitoxin SocA domain-containing protein [Cereibacter azotoformans]ULB08731.1 DUF4065 domain-containing protein [Cereibacter azotoformans]